MSGYQYPLRADWSTEEIVAVIDFFNKIEQAYESQVKREDLMSAYRAFKSVVPSIAEEKTLCREFEEGSGYAAYPVVKKMKATENGEMIKGPHM